MGLPWGRQQSALRYLTLPYRTAPHLPHRTTSRAAPHRSKHATQQDGTHAFSTTTPAFKHATHDASHAYPTKIPARVRANGHALAGCLHACTHLAEEAAELVVRSLGRLKLLRDQAFHVCIELLPTSKRKNYARKAGMGGVA